jgi:hypothetical protein
MLPEPKSPLPHFPKGVNQRNSFENPPLKKGDLKISHRKEFLANAIADISDVINPNIHHTGKYPYRTGVPLSRLHGPYLS